MKVGASEASHKPVAIFQLIRTPPVSFSSPLHTQLPTFPLTYNTTSTRIPPGRTRAFVRIAIPPVRPDSVVRLGSRCPAQHCGLPRQVQSHTQRSQHPRWVTYQFVGVYHDGLASGGRVRTGRWLMWCAQSFITIGPLMDVRVLAIHLRNHRVIVLSDIYEDVYTCGGCDQWVLSTYTWK